MLSVKPRIDLKQLYEIDEHLWLEETINLLKTNRLQELDIENLIEELESLSRRDKAKVESLLEQVIIPLLLLHYWRKESERNKTHWETEIFAFRGQLNRLLTTNLTQYLESKLENIYQRAVKFTTKKTKLNPHTFPEKCPYSMIQLLDDDWF
jgi:hypothetical protein